MLELLSQVNWYIVLWLAVVVVFLGVEMATVTLTSIWFAVGGLIALFVAMASCVPRSISPRESVYLCARLIASSSAIGRPCIEASKSLRLCSAE